MQGYERSSEQAALALNRLRGRAVEQAGPDDEREELAKEASRCVASMDAIAARLIALGLPDQLLRDYSTLAGDFIEVAKGGGTAGDIEDAYAEWKATREQLDGALRRIAETLRQRVDNPPPTD
jgi:hypothetical protein